MRLGGDKADRNDLPAPQMSLYISPKALTEHNNAIEHVLGPNSLQGHQRQLWIQGLYVLGNGVGCSQQGLIDTCALIGESDISRPSVSRGWRQRRGERERAKQPDAIKELSSLTLSTTSRRSTNQVAIQWGDIWPRDIGQLKPSPSGGMALGSMARRW